jgi:hypothetical protein
MSHASVQPVIGTMYISPPSDGPWEEWELQRMRGRRVIVEAVDVGGTRRIVATIIGAEILRASGGARLTLRVPGPIRELICPESWAMPN